MGGYTRSAPASPHPQGRPIWINLILPSHEIRDGRGEREVPVPQVPLPEPQPQGQEAMKRSSGRPARLDVAASPSSPYQRDGMSHACSLIPSEGLHRQRRVMSHARLPLNPPRTSSRATHAPLTGGAGQAEKSGSISSILYWYWFFLRVQGNRSSMPTRPRPGAGV